MQGMMESLNNIGGAVGGGLGGLGNLGGTVGGIFNPTGTTPRLQHYYYLLLATTEHQALRTQLVAF